MANERTGGRTPTSVRLAVIAGLGTAVLFAVFAFAGGAQASPPAIQSLRSNTYQSITVTFSEPVFTTTASGAGSDGRGIGVCPPP